MFFMIFMVVYHRNRMENGIIFQQIIKKSSGCKNIFSVSIVNPDPLGLSKALKQGAPGS